MAAEVKMEDIRGEGEEEAHELPRGLRVANLRNTLPTKPCQVDRDTRDPARREEALERDQMRLHPAVRRRVGSEENDTHRIVDTRRFWKLCHAATEQLHGRCALLGVTRPRVKSITT